MAGELGDRERRRVREAVAGADDELVEGVLRVEAVAVPAVRGRRLGRPGAAARAGPLAFRGLLPVLAHDLDERALAEHGRGGAAQERQIALGDGGSYVLRRAYVDRVAADVGELERVEPDVELEVGRLLA